MHLACISPAPRPQARRFEEEIPALADDVALAEKVHKVQAEIEARVREAERGARPTAATPYPVSEAAHTPQLPPQNGAAANSTNGLASSSAGCVSVVALLYSSQTPGVNRSHHGRVVGGQGCMRIPGFQLHLWE